MTAAVTGRAGVRAALALAVVAGALAAAQRVAQQAPWPTRFAPPPASAVQAPAAAATSRAGDTGPISRSVSSTPGAAVHAASGLALADGRLRAVWFSGSREGAADVEIRTATFDPASGRWSAEATALSRAQVARDLNRAIKKLGNPVLAHAPDGRLHLYVVTVTLGGWAGSSITRYVSDDQGATWHGARRLVTSPFLNLGTLVKGRPLAYPDGGVGLPVYHELVTRFPEWLRLDADGRVLDRVRFPGGELSLQPVVLVQGDSGAEALMRHAADGTPPRVQRSRTDDAGRSWSRLADAGLPNPNAAVSGLVTRRGDWLLVFNDSERDRGNLSLARAEPPAAGQAPAWRRLALLDGAPPPEPTGLPAADYRARLTDAAARVPDARGPTPPEAAGAITDAAARQLCFGTPVGETCNREYSYPTLIEDADGTVHLLYTWHRARIAHLALPRAWIDARIAATEGAR